MDIPFLDVKYEIEKYIKNLDLEFSVYLHTCFFSRKFGDKKGTRGFIKMTVGNFFI